MLSASIVSRFSFPPAVVDVCNAVGMTDAHVWRDAHMLFSIDVPMRRRFERALLEKCLDGATEDTAATWAEYVDDVAVYVATDRVILRPLADLDDRAYHDTDIVDVVGPDFRPVWEVPAWCEGIDTIGRAADTGNHGAAAMALPCVFYAEALRVMSEHGDDVVQYIDDSGCFSDLQPLTLSPSSQSWTGFASHVLSIAVELWCGEFVELDVANRYVVARVGRIHNDMKAGV